MILLSYLNFCFKNYMRRHRYTWELVAVVIFSIFFGGFLSSSEFNPSVWIVFFPFAFILNLLTAPSLFFLEKGNELYFLIAKPNGRKYFFLAKVILIILIDLFWVLLFAVLYGFRFIEPVYFETLPINLFLILIALLLSTLLMSITYTYHQKHSWLVFTLLVFGAITNKPKLLTFDSLSDGFNLVAFLLPPYQELIFMTLSFELSGYNILFLITAFAQIALIYFISQRRMMRKDLL